MQEKYEAVKRYRKKVKGLLVEAFGGECCVCGYSRCSRSLVFHHLDPETKSFGLSRNNRACWAKLVAEARKCVMVCSNCHGEIGDALVEIPANAKRFDEGYAQAVSLPIRQYDSCPVCGKQKPVGQTTCSMRCFAQIREQVNWEAADLKGMIAGGITFIEMGRRLGVTDNAVRKQARKRGLPITVRERRKAIKTTGA